MSRGDSVFEDNIRNDEAERCALLCEQLAAIHRAGAALLREDGSYTTRTIWPFGKLITCVKPGYEREAKIRDAAVQTLTVIAECIRKGYDPHELGRGDGRLSLSLSSSDDAFKDGEWQH